MRRGDDNETKETKDGVEQEGKDASDSDNETKDGVEQEGKDASDSDNETKDGDEQEEEYGSLGAAGDRWSMDDPFAGVYLQEPSAAFWRRMNGNRRRDQEIKEREAMKSRIEGYLTQREQATAARVADATRVARIGAMHRLSPNIIRNIHYSINGTPAQYQRARQEQDADAPHRFFELQREERAAHAASEDRRFRRQAADWSPSPSPRNSRCGNGRCNIL
jgi:hypothetical protein